MSLEDKRAALMARRDKYQEALMAAVLQPDMLIDRKRTFRTEWIKMLEDALASIEKQIAEARAPYSLRVGAESI